MNDSHRDYMRKYYESKTLEELYDMYKYFEGDYYGWPEDLDLLCMIIEEKENKNV